MKKKLILFLTTVMMMALLSGCGSGSEAGSETSPEAGSQAGSDTGSASNINMSEIKVEDYVTLGEYKGLQVSAPTIQVDEAEQKQLVQQVYYSEFAIEDGGITDRAVKNGDLVNIDYEGKKDGVAFSGGTAQNQQLGIGSNSFIDGFEDGLIGVNPGETVDLNLTFPDPYTNPELAGQAVVFTVTVNYIYPEYNDDYVASWGEESYKTVEELEQYVYDYLYMVGQSEYDYIVENAVVGQFLSQCTFNEIPKELLEKYRNRLQGNIESEAAMYNMDAESYCQYAYGMMLTNFLDSYTEESVKQIVALQAVANVEGLNRTDEELEVALKEAAEANGYATVEEFIGVNSREEYREYYMFEDVIDFLIENAVITVQ